MHESAPPLQQSEHSVADALLEMFHDFGVRQAWGVIGGGCAPLAHAIGRSRIDLVHAKHESGAAFAALEASVATGRPVAVFATTGPGVLNALNGCMAARWDGARIVLVTGMSSHAHRGRFPVQETSAYTMPVDALYTAGALFHYAAAIASADELPEVRRRLATGFARRDGFVAHVGLPAALQGQPVPRLAPRRSWPTLSAPAPSGAALDDFARLLDDGPLCVWVGAGARASHAAVRALVEKTGAVAIASPRAKGVVAESHPQYAGVTGAGGHEQVPEILARCGVRRTLVLGSKLGEVTSFWDPRLVPPEGFVHVDIDPSVPGVAYPDAPTVAVHGEVGAVVEALLPKVRRKDPVYTGGLARDDVVPPRDGAVRPRALLQALQRVVVDGSDAVVMSESGNAFSWANYHLRFDEPLRYRTSPGWGTMGHMTAGVVGAAHATGKAVVSLVGDGAMLMHNEVNTAVHLGARAVWVVLNDAAFGIVKDGMRALGFEPVGTSFPRTDFVMFARSMGAGGVLVTDERELEGALAAALAHDGPFVVDVHIDGSEMSPAIRQRVTSLNRQFGRKG